MRARLARQACETCRKRKVRCDSDPSQCSNCRQLGLTCEYSSERRKRGPKPRTGFGTDVTHVSETIPPPSPQSVVRSGSVLGEAEAEERGHSVGSPLATSSRPLRYTHNPLQPPQSPFGFSPRTDGGTPRIRFAPEPDHRPLQVHQSLTAALEALGLPIEDTVLNCIDKHILWSFPSSPVIHPSTLRQHIRLLLPCSSYLFEPSAEEAQTDAAHSPHGLKVRAFTLLTSICALVACRTRRSSMEVRVDPSLAPFLAASRNMLSCFEDWDVSHADSSSLVIRTCHSAAFHHLGQTKKSWYVLGDALRLAMDMRLYDESSYEGLEPLEAKLRKNLFISLTMSDQSASVLNNRPLVFHEMYLDEAAVNPVNIRDELSLLGPDERHYEPPYERQLHEGFYLAHRLWSIVTDILVDLKTLTRLYTRAGCEIPSQDPVQMGIMRSYMDFCGMLDALPSWLRNPDTHNAANDAATLHQRQTFWHQRANIVLTYHCLRLILLRRAMEKGFCSLLGLTDNPDMLALRKIEIARDLAAAATNTPFEALQANGEPLVEKLRQVGVSLLEVVHQSENATVSSRAQSFLSTIIDIIARLDSRVSDELSGPLRPE
ncbi:hypothetical protein B0T10DRAFT_584204 [Thelonectria olida]|uniref:Zn(2)-C6 fungal-type domain-containing protein n=1 Tax=Thelonectria olida TaxID=1576542 RepID=A0A9P8WFP8_9HYPO|nr:hypothetical protein B0T10DRAFT_584204 [Thelonectria olida]